MDANALQVDEMAKRAESEGTPPKIYIHCTAGMGRYIYSYMYIHLCATHIRRFTVLQAWEGACQSVQVCALGLETWLNPKPTL